MINSLFASSLSFIILNISNIFISNDISSIMNILSNIKKIENNTLIANDIFNIFLQSEYYNEKD